MTLIAELTHCLGANGVLQGADAAAYGTDWTGQYTSTPLAVARPTTTAEVSAVVKLARAHKTPIVPASGRTGLVGGTQAEASLILSLERMNRIRDIRAESQVAIVEAGVILSNLHAAVEPHGLAFPMTFGARGSCMLGGMISTNAGGSNVLRYGNTRALVLGLEVVLPDGEIMDLMSELRKDNSGYDLKDLYIGAEGTLGIVTAAVVKLVPKPRAYATAMVATPTLPDALALLNRLQQATGGAVEAFEYMPGRYIEMHRAVFPSTPAPFDTPQDVNILVEVGATASRDAELAEDGSLPIVTYLQATLMALMEEGAVLDAVVAQNQAQRAAMWARREAAAEVAFAKRPFVNTDVAVPLDKVDAFLAQFIARMAELDPGAENMVVAHLGDGNIHPTVWPTRADAALSDALRDAVEEIAVDLGGSFSAEHGIGLSKLPAMQRHKDPVARRVMQQIKNALDPDNLMNPGKVLP